MEGHIVDNFDGADAEALAMAEQSNTLGQEDELLLNPQQVLQVVISYAHQIGRAIRKGSWNEKIAIMTALLAKARPIIEKQERQRIIREVASIIINNMEADGVIDEDGWTKLNLREAGNQLQTLKDR